MRLEEAIDHLEELLADENHKWPCDECQEEHEQLLGWLKELKGLRLENEVILRRLKHLLESDYISQFDQVDPNTQEYIRDIREADRKVMYLCDREKPCKKHCEKDHLCKRTSDISHAKNFRLVPNGIYPIIFEEVDEHCIANVTFDREQLQEIVDERVIKPIKNGELVVKKEKRPTGEWIPVKYRPLTVDERIAFARYTGIEYCDTVSEKAFDCLMPEDRQEILVSASWGVGTDVADNDTDGEGFTYYGLEGNGDWEGIDAWMPLPKPYKEAEDEDL